MKTAVIISDSHGNMRLLTQLYPLFAEADYVIHLGDTSSDASKIARDFPDKVISLNGNCDPIKLGENERVLELEGVKIFLCHGHAYSVKTTAAKLAARAKELGCTLAFYGHTHAAREEQVDGVTLVNPGSAARYSKNGYCYLAVSGGKAVTKLVSL